MKMIKNCSVEKTEEEKERKMCSGLSSSCGADWLERFEKRMNCLFLLCGGRPSIPHS